jgi:Uma2 family endonuclease
MSTPALQTRRLYTYDDLLSEFPQSNQPCELWDGELIMAPAPLYPHQRISYRIQRALHEWVERHGLGEVVGAPIDMVLSPHRAVQPDVVYVARENLGIIQGAVRGPADLVVEIISPGGRQRDRVEKKDLYEQYGIKEYWIIDPEARTLEVFTLGSSQQYALLGRYRSGDKATSALLPGFEIGVDEIMRGKAE